MHVCSSPPWNSPISLLGHSSETKNLSRCNDTAIFHLTPTYYLISLVQMPLLRTGLNTLTFRPYSENSLASTSIPPCSSLSAPFSTLNPSGSAADGWALRKGLQEWSGLLSGTFQSYCAGIERDGLKRDWHRFESLRDETNEGKTLMAKKSLEENTKNSQFVQTIHS